MRACNQPTHHLSYFNRTSARLIYCVAVAVCENFVGLDIPDADSQGARQRQWHLVVGYQELTASIMRASEHMWALCVTVMR